jgi:hypothetical protein
MAEEQPITSRPGSPTDLVRRMERLEINHESLVRDVAALAGTVARVELNQAHAAELNKLRFDSLDASITGVGATLERFMSRINAIVSGEVKTPREQQGDELVRDYIEWRDRVDHRLDTQDVTNGQIRLLARLAILVVGGNALGIMALIYKNLIA